MNWVWEALTIKHSDNFVYLSVNQLLPFSLQYIKKNVKFGLFFELLFTKKAVLSYLFSMCS